MRIKLAYLISFCALHVLCSCGKKGHSPEACLTAEEQHRLLQTMVRYSSGLAPEATHETKFDDRFNWYYDKAVDEMQILYCDQQEEDSAYSLLVARQARSVTPMQEGIAVKIKFDEDGGFAEYDEIFRMWKMPADTLRKRGLYLFKRMIHGEDLTIYYTKFQKDRFIEFPDDRFVFDKKNRRWHDRELDSLDIN